jgi:Na+-translocating ferredoxin:NAD+ oxidoreductase RnfE subunit
MNWLSKYYDKQALYWTLHSAIALVAASSVLATIGAFEFTESVVAGNRSGVLADLAMFLLGAVWVVIGRGIILAQFQRAAAFNSTPSSLASEHITTDH